MRFFTNMFEYRELLKTNIKKDIRGKYKGSILGVFWSFLNPLLQVVVYWAVFPFLMGRAGAVDNYLFYLVTGIIPWTFFTTVVNMGTTSMMTNAGIIKKIYFPKEILVVSQVLSGLVNFAISCLIVLLFAFITNAGFSYHLVWLPVIAIIQALLTLGVLLFLAPLQVYIQDIQYVVAFLLNMGFYASPILYRVEVLESAGMIGKLVKHNPITILIEGYHSIFITHQTPDLMGLFLVFLLGLILFFVGLGFFNQLQKNFAEKL